MKFSTRSTYGLKAIVNLARHPASERVPLSVIAKEENISAGYLERIFRDLKGAKLIRADKGAAGGYQLARRPERINAWEIIRTLEGKGKLFYCLDEQGKVFCSKSCNCGANQVLLKVESALSKTLAALKLSELIKTRSTPARNASQALPDMPDGRS